MLETLIGVGILVVVVLAAKTIFKRTVAVNNTPISGGGTSSPSEIPPRHNDGSVTPSSPVAEE